MRLDCDVTALVINQRINDRTEHCIQRQTFTVTTHTLVHNVIVLLPLVLLKLSNYCNLSDEYELLLTKVMIFLTVALLTFLYTYSK